LGRCIWRFADLTTRPQYLLDGFGWCYVPTHLVAAAISAGRQSSRHRGRKFSLALYIVHERGGPAAPGAGLSRICAGSSRSFIRRRFSLHPG
jgi:hypothetical protein